jgi:hypothetical protein
MKSAYAVLSLALSLAVFSHTHAQTLSCAEKQREIEQQITYATLHHQKDRAASLEIALANNKAHCTDEQLVSEQKKRIQDKKEKVSKAKNKLDEAKQKGKPGKIKERTDELNEAIKELEAEEAILKAK